MHDQSMTQGQGQTIINLLNEQNRKIDGIRQDMSQVKHDINTIASILELERDQRGNLVKSA